MSITKETAQDKIEVVGDFKLIQVRTATIIKEDGKELSLAKIGKELNISRERVRQLEHQALAHLRRRKVNVKDYLAAS